MGILKQLVLISFSLSLGLTGIDAVASQSNALTQLSAVSKNNVALSPDKINKANTSAAMCLNQQYKFYQQGGACMPNPKTGFANPAACNKLYYCVLQSAYHRYIYSRHNGYSIRINKPNLHQSTSFHFIPDNNTTFNTFDVTPNNPTAPISCTKGNCKTNTLVWVTQLNQLKNKMCHNPTLRSMYSNKDDQFTNALGLYIRQLVGMPPLKATVSVQHPYDEMGLYILSSPKTGKVSLTPKNAKELPIYYQQINGMPTLLAKDKHYQVNQKTASVLRLCRSTTELTRSYCSNLPKGNKAYNTWTKAWVKLVYPSNFLSTTNHDKGYCQLSGKTVDCTLTNIFFPWTSIGSTYNWNNYSGLKPQQALHQGLYEYGIPQDVNFSKQHLTFIKIDQIFPTLCSK